MSGYPVIINGDHAEFEREHANTPTHQRPDWPLPSFDARDWAAAFCKVARELGYTDLVDEEWMVGWFANALMRGHDEHVARSAPAFRGMLTVLREVEEFLDDRADVDDGIPNAAMRHLVEVRAAIAKAESL